ncbi:hypothetical protein BJV77DRAFT_600266 [Russula vinacea]|nr:hypothetical protein BJV77DRAFT_600266 [Russula vinacea]
MSDDQHQSLNEYHSDVVTPRGTLPNTAPPVPHNQAHNQATMPREYTTHPAPEISPDGIFVPPPGAHPAYFDPYRASYVPHYGPIPPWDGTTYVHHQAPHAPQLNSIAPAQPCGITTATAGRPPTSDMSLSMAENTPAPSGRLPKRSRQDFEDDGYHPTVPGSSMPNICRNLAARFVNDPRSNITAMRMESSAGHSKVMFELEIPNDA